MRLFSAAEERSRCTKPAGSKLQNGRLPKASLGKMKKTVTATQLPQIVCNRTGKYVTAIKTKTKKITAT